MAVAATFLLVVLLTAYACMFRVIVRYYGFGSHRLWTLPVHSVWNPVHLRHRVHILEGPHRPTDLLLSLSLAFLSLSRF